LKRKELKIETRIQKGKKEFKGCGGRRQGGKKRDVNGIGFETRGRQSLGKNRTKNEKRRKKEHQKRKKEKTLQEVKNQDSGKRRKGVERTYAQ